MPAQVYTYNTTDITWDTSETEVDQSSVDFVAISCVGFMEEDGNTLSNALTTIPNQIAS